MESRFALRPAPPLVRPWLVVVAVVFILAPSAGLGIWLYATGHGVATPLLLPFFLFALPVAQAIAAMIRRRRPAGDLVVDATAVAIPALGGNAAARIPLDEILFTWWSERVGLVVGGTASAGVVPARCFAGHDDVARAWDAVVAAIRAQLGDARADAIVARGRAALSHQRTPTRAVWGVLAVLALLFGFAIAAGGFDAPDGLVRLGAAQRELVAAGAVWRLFTGPLLHGGALHLALNGLALYAVGAILERWLGWQRLVVILFGSALAGAVGSVVARDVASVGLSGGVFGLLGALLLSSWRYRRSPTTGPRLPAARWATVLIANALVSALPGIDFVAHGVGLVAGAALCALLAPRLVDERPAPPLVGKRPVLVAAALLLALNVASLAMMVAHAL